MKNISQFYPQDGGVSQLASKLRQRHPMYRVIFQTFVCSLLSRPDFILVVFCLLWSDTWSFELNENAVAPPGGKGGSFPSMGDVQKLCNMCVLSLSWNFFVSRQIHCKAFEQRATLIHRQYNRDWGTSYSRPPIDPYLTSPLLQNPGGATASMLCYVTLRWTIWMKSRETVTRRHIFSALYCSNKVTSTETLVILNSPQLHLPHFKLKLKLF